MSELRPDYDAIILAVSHNEFLEISLDKLKSDKCVIFDVKSLLPHQYCRRTFINQITYTTYYYVLKSTSHRRPI